MEKSEIISPLFCQKCGSKLVPGASFCPGCGNLVGGEQRIRNENTDEVSNAVAKAMAIFAILLYIVAHFIPFWRIDLWETSQFFDLWQGDSYIISIIGIVLAIVLLVELIFNSKEKKRDTTFWGIVITIAGVVRYYDGKSGFSSQKLLGKNVGELVSPGIAFYLILASGIILIVAGTIMCRINKQKK